MMISVGPEQRARSGGAANHSRQKQKSGGSVGGSLGQKQKSPADKGSSASAMDRQLESVMSAAREVLLQPRQGNGSLKRQIWSR